jgi:hypothetical protein
VESLVVLEDLVNPLLDALLRQFLQPYLADLLVAFNQILHSHLLALRPLYLIHYPQQVALAGEPDLILFLEIFPLEVVQVLLFLSIRGAVKEAGDLVLDDGGELILDGL